MVSTSERKFLTKGPEYYREWAKAMRVIADHAHSESARGTLLRAADNYEGMAIMAALTQHGYQDMTHRCSP